jgi:FMN phosphatase YigB (HAD superfamily)
LAKLISFDIDGTLETGDPPGRITSCSDRTVSMQQRMWEKHGITVSFTVLKHCLDQVRAQYDAEHYVHIGDTNIDKYYAELHGFVYLFPDDSIDHLWQVE